ncbi:hypothetical protein T484DRAFT_1848623 [Baffinella frigidus]|nr:hypothetical protein T484DRAFT_1848623 [Cryptophyta sp. CCMP2293]
MPVSTPKVAPALWIAAACGKEEDVRQLLADGADIEERGGPWKSSALQEAAVGSHESVVRLLLEEGANVSAKDINGTTPIHFATDEEVGSRNGWGVVEGSSFQPRERSAVDQC